MLGYFYKLILPISGMFYLGSTTRITERIRSHRSLLKTGKHTNSNLIKAWKEFGESVIHVELFRCSTIEEAQQMETEAIAANANNPLMTNIGVQAVGGDNLTRNPSKQIVVKKIVAGLHRRYARLTDDERRAMCERMKGENNPMYGRRHSEEACKKISVARTGHSYNKGCKLSPERIAKMSAFAKTRTGDKNPFYGRHHSHETKELLRFRNKGSLPPNVAAIEINGVEYTSQAAAARALGVCAATITYRLSSKNPKYADYRTIKQANT